MRKTHFFSFLAVLAAVMLALGCRKKLTPANLELVRQEMSKKEVESILGQPTRVETKDIPLFSTTTYLYEQGKDRVTIVFINDKLVTKTGSVSK